MLDYCLEATVRCTMELCDTVYVNDGGSTDGTIELLRALSEEYGRDRLVLVERKWVHDRTVWAVERNHLIDMVPEESYVLCIDADEVFHEDEMPLINSAVESGKESISFNVIHFYGRPTHFIDGPAWYGKHTRLWKKSTGIKLVHREHGCADDVVWPDGMPAHLSRDFNCGASIYHYGNCRHPRALGMKSKKADDLYQYSKDYLNGGTAEPRSFSYALDSVGAKIFTGAHPKYVKNWCAAHNDQPTDYMIDDNVNKLWCFTGEKCE
jgi:glycosyltransferase involved in cell wall biosynthesis